MESANNLVGRLMIANKSSHRSTAGRGVPPNLLFAESSDRPSSKTSLLIESGISLFVEPSLTVPEVPVGLDNQPGLLKHKVGLEASEHRLVHFELQPTPFKFVKKQHLNRCHLFREVLVQSGLTYLLPRPWRKFVTKSAFITAKALANFRSLLRRDCLFQSEVGLAKFLTCLCRFWSSEHPKSSFLSSLKGRVSSPIGVFSAPDTTRRFATFWAGMIFASHFMFNYNTAFGEEALWGPRQI